jgi:uncharacterized Zn finger protein
MTSMIKTDRGNHMITFNNQDILKYCGAKAYEKGRTCASLDYFIKVFVQDATLFGLYQGTVGTYRINIVFENNTPQRAWCTCPAMSEHDGVCKHIVGLMILWDKSAREFVKIKPWQSLLAHYDRDALLKFIETVASKSLDTTNALYEELHNEPLFDYDDVYDPEEW